MAPVRLPRAHRVVMRLAGDRVRIYWYRRRGQTPAMITFEGDSMAEALAAEADGAPLIAKAYETAKPLPPAQTVSDLVTRYKAAPNGFQRCAESTKVLWRPWLDALVDEFGDLPIAALGAKGVRADIIDWRDRFAATPRAADTAMQATTRVFSWALERELIDKNPAAGIEGLYSANRADVIVEPHELEAILAHTSKAGRLAFRLAAATGMRRGDLIDLRWNEVGDFAIERAANKSTQGRRLTVPLTAEARQVLAELRARRDKAKVPSVYVLTSRIGPWDGHGLGATWWKAAKEAKIDKHLNDLRGTACTRFCMVPLTDEEIADIMAWEPARVRQIRKRYVDRDRIAKGIVARMEKAERSK